MEWLWEKPRHDPGNTDMQYPLQKNLARTKKDRVR
jgi:hypothetical protein